MNLKRNMRYIGPVIAVAVGAGAATSTHWLLDVPDVDLYGLYLALVAILSSLVMVFLFGFISTWYDAGQYSATAGVLLFLNIVGLAGIATIVLPFDYDVTPLMASLEFEDLFVVLGAPFLLAIAVSGGWLRILVSGHLRLSEKILAWSLAIAASAATTYFLIGEVDLFDSLQGQPETFIPSTLLLTVPFFLIGAIMNRKTEGIESLLAMQAAYLPHAVLIIFAFFEQIGALIGLITVVIYVAQIAFCVINAKRIREVISRSGQA